MTKTNHNTRLLPSLALTLLFFSFPINIFGADSVEFSLDGESIEAGPIESPGGEAIDSTKFDRAFADPVKKKPVAQQKQKQKQKQSKDVVLLVGAPNAKAVVSPKAVALPNAAVKKAVSVDTKNKIVKPATAPVAPLRSTDPYWKKVIKVVKDQYQLGRDAAASWAKKLKMKWQQSAK